MIRLASVASLLVFLSHCSAWAPLHRMTQFHGAWNTNRATSSTAISAISRRHALVTAFSPLILTQVSFPAQAGLLDDYGTDPKVIQQKPDPRPASTPGTAATGKGQIDPTLRSSYYYPTAKKRYLPRIQKLSQEIVAVPDAIAEANWELLEEFGKTADNAVLPLQLYQSSLDGQGLSLSTDFAKKMKVDALQFQSAYQLYAKALSQRDIDKLRVAVADMATAVADYREQGRLTDDLDASQIPSLEEMRRMAMRKPTMK